MIDARHCTAQSQGSRSTPQSVPIANHTHPSPSAIVGSHRNELFKSNYSFHKTQTMFKRTDVMISAINKQQIQVTNLRTLAS